MEEIEIHSFNNYRAIVSAHAFHKWIFRGQNEAKYKLESYLYRTIKRSEKIRSLNEQKKVHLIRENFERAMIETFKSCSNIFLDQVPDKSSEFDWLALMQHYGAPTRLLDFSFSPYIALYFAISGATSDAAVFCVNCAKLLKKDNLSFEEINEKYASIMEQEKDITKTMVVPFEPSFKNERLFAQQGVFLVPNSLNFSHHDILSEYEIVKGTKLFEKLIIKSDCFVEMITELQKMNINASTIYPGFEGFCKSFENIGVLPSNTIQNLPNFFEDSID